MIWPEYEPAYRDFTFIVLRNIDQPSHSSLLINTTWNQVGTFNQTFGSQGTNLKNAYAGCVPVAVGQLMHYHKKPSYINWTNMPLNYGTTITSNFLLDIARVGHAKFTDNGTSVLDSEIIPIFTHYGYNAQKTGFSETIAYSEIRSKRPVMILGENLSTGSGHAYILCGENTVNYQEILEVWSFPDPNRFRVIHQDITQHSGTMYYINWGWGGNSDGYYSEFKNMITNTGSAYKSEIMIYGISYKK